MPDLLTQLSDYSRQLDDETPPLAAFVTPVVARSPRRATTRPWLVVAGAAVAVLLLVGLPLLINRLWFATPPAQESPVTTVAPPTTATTVPDAGFDYSTDNLCDWFTADDMNRIVAAAQERAVTGWLLFAFVPEDCVRLAPPVERRWLGQRDWNHTIPKGEFGEGEMVDAVPGLAVGLVPVAWTGEEPTTEFVGHEMLDESVTYGNLQYLCSWSEIVMAELRVEGHEDDVLWFSLTRYNPYSACPDDETYKAQVTALGLAVADAMLEEMGWIDQRPGQVDVVDDPPPVVTTVPQVLTEASDLRTWGPPGPGTPVIVLDPDYPYIDGWYFIADRWKQLVDPPSYEPYDGSMPPNSELVVDAQDRRLEVNRWRIWKRDTWQADAPDVEFAVLLVHPEVHPELVHPEEDMAGWDHSWGLEIVDALRLDAEGDEHFHINCAVGDDGSSSPETQAVAVIVGDYDNGSIRRAWTVDAFGFDEWQNLDTVHCGPAAQKP